MGFLLISIFALVWIAAPFRSDANYKADYQPAGDPKGEFTALSDQPSLPTIPDTGERALINALPLERAAPPGANHHIVDTPSTFSPVEPALPASQLSMLEVSGNPGELKSFIIQKGDTLSKLFSNAGLPLVTAIKLARTQAAAVLKNLSPGQEIRFYFNQDNQLDTIEYDVNDLDTLVAAPLPKGDFLIAEHNKAVSYESFSASGEINSTLSQAADDAGISLPLALALVDIFKWEIDFARDIQPGDQFRMIYQKAYVDGGVIGNGPILAAEFINNGTRLQAVRFIDENGDPGYYTPEGDSMRRGFLRTPVELARISSGFSKRRFHPIKKRWKAHNGVDYAARTGTPVLAAGDGTVQFAGNKNGYGKTVVLRHGGKYTTLYAHMSKYGRGVRSGKRVKQGQIIGYVGSTGLATGPHLHYEFRVYGQHKNPLKVKLPKAIALEKKYMPRFKQESAELLAKLEQLVPTRVAAN